MRHFNPRAPYGARQQLPLVGKTALGISIHAPHTGRDVHGHAVPQRLHDFNPRAPYGARPSMGRKLRDLGEISIHAPHTGRDVSLCPHWSAPTEFQSTRPIRGATVTGPRASQRLEFQSTRPIRGATPTRPRMWPFSDISIHAPHTGRDRRPGGYVASRQDFNPRAPYGARQAALYDGHAALGFQSTRPIRGATRGPPTGRKDGANFNPRAPYGARHTVQSAGRDDCPDFNPRAPYGARQQKCIIYVLHFCNNRQSKHKNQQETSSVRTFF